MTPRIETLEEKKLIGMRLDMSLADNRTAQLWKSFMPRRKEITDVMPTDVISLQIYDASYFEAFNPTNRFEKWAALQVTDFNNVPDGMETLTVPGGLYAVFDYKGPSNDSRIFQHIFGVWLPGSTYSLDNRPHFEVLGEQYRNNDPASEEEIWIPVRPKPHATPRS